MSCHSQHLPLVSTLNAASQAVLVGWPQPSEPTDLRSGERLAGLEEAAIVVPVGLLPVKKW